MRGPALPLTTLFPFGPQQLTTPRCRYHLSARLSLPLRDALKSSAAGWSEKKSRQSRAREADRQRFEHVEFGTLDALEKEPLKAYLKRLLEEKPELVESQPVLYSRGNLKKLLRTLDAFGAGTLRAQVPALVTALRTAVGL